MGYASAACTWLKFHRRNTPAAIDALRKECDLPGLMPYLHRRKIRHSEWTGNNKVGYFFNFDNFVGRMKLNSSDAFHDFLVLIEYPVQQWKAKLQKAC